MTAVLVIAGWLALGVPLGLWAAKNAAKDYRPEKLDVSPGLACLTVIAWAPVVAVFVAIYFVQRPITRWALANASERTQQPEGA